MSTSQLEAVATSPARSRAGRRPMASVAGVQYGCRHTELVWVSDRSNPHARFPGTALRRCQHAHTGPLPICHRSSTSDSTPYCEATCAPDPVSRALALPLTDGTASTDLQRRSCRSNRHKLYRHKLCQTDVPIHSVPKCASITWKLKSFKGRRDDIEDGE
ncbi:hypothetical protein AAFF_G00073790 [Aldrovandia affinis]|uniref:Uncharacterized protein n=1 Tax=Aldrovandia affinis TaxID=143900 RepID=A0AAD7WCX2_9TELE|nr:hypothetical protein AAFF_G00073790 [Aldrovandia affinis]